ncbi:MAG: hypothetical protein ABI440_01100 [Casimicrobiaceae bacterium]
MFRGRPLIDRRVNRRGFPAVIAGEIDKLAAHCEALQPPGRTRAEAG